MRHLVVAGIALCWIGCSSTPTPTDSGEPETCDEPDRSCPGSRPYEGAPCDVSEPCFYVPMDGEEWTYTCTAGAWVGSVECMLLGGGCPPPLAESCSPPVRDHGPGSVEIGPVGSGAFATFTEGEHVMVRIGGQGSPMIEYRLRLDDTAPSCVEVITTLRSPVSTEVVDRRNVRVRCGRTLGIFVIVPSADDCTDPSAPVLVDLEVEVTGIGTTTARIEVPGGAFCAALPG